MRGRAFFGLPWPILLAYGATTLLLAWPLLREPDRWGILDWDQHTFHHAVARAAILEEGDFPLWNPYYRSGVPLLANPESRVLAPGFPLVLVFGASRGLKLEILLHLLLALVGMHALLRALGASPLAAAAGSLVFAFDGWIVVHLTVGHVWALNAAYLPWILLATRRSVERPEWTLAVAALLALVFFGGGIYPLAITGLLMLGLAVGGVVFARESARRHGIVLALAILISLPLAAVKLLPSAELMQRHPRRTVVDGGYTGPALLHALVDRDQALLAAWQDRPEEFNGTQVHESLYVGVLPLVLALLGVLGGGRRAAPWCLAAALCLWVALGTRVWPSAWMLLHPLPVFDQLRMPQRFGLGAVLAFAVLAAFGLDALLREGARRTGRPGLARGLAIGCVATIAGDLLLVGSRTFADAFPVPPLALRREHAFRQYKALPRYDATGFTTRPASPLLASIGALYPAFLAGRGSTVAYEILPVPSRARPVGSPDYRGELWLAAAGPGRVRTARWSQNRLEVEVRSETDDLLVVNQNHEPGWRVVAPAGRRVIDHEGLLAVPVGSGDRRVVLRYRPTSFVVGAWVSALSWLALLAVGVALRRCGVRSA